MTLPAGWVLAPPITIDQAAAHAYRANFRGEGGAIMLAIAKAESGLVPNNRNVNTDTRRTIDRGILQFNSYWHSEVSDVEADDPARAFVAGYRVSAGGSSFGQWSTYNGGQYKTHLAAARAAMAKVEQQAGGAQLPAAATYDPVFGGQLSLDRVRTPPLTVDQLVFQGQAFPNLPMARWVTGATLDLSVDEASQLTLTLADPFSAGFYAAVGTDVDLAELRFSVTDKQHQPSSGPLEEITVTALSAGVEKLRWSDPTGASQTWANIAPGTVLVGEAADVGLLFVGEGGPVFPSITRLGRDDDTGDGSSASTQRDRAESNWELAERLARREGKWRFEASGTLYYARPSWLVARMTRFVVVWRRAAGRTDLPAEFFEPLEAPACSAGVDEDSWNRAAGPKEISIVLARGLADRIRPGMVMEYDGTVGFNTKRFNRAVDAPEGYLVTRVTVDLADPTAGVRIQAREAIDPTPVPEEGDPNDPSVAAASTTPGAPVSSSSASALDMVTVALRQVGDRYVYGSEADPKDPDPDAFDCSELIQWACAQVGVTFADGSGNQIFASEQAGLGKSVAEAARIRGALLWHPGHVAISLGDGVNTVEARGRKYGVVQGPIGVGRFDRAGLIPGLYYGVAGGSGVR